MAKRNAPRAFEFQLFHARILVNQFSAHKGAESGCARDYIAICGVYFSTNKNVMSAKSAPSIHGFASRSY
jgi:hypothetical protein